MMNGDQKASELLEAQAHIWNHMLNFINSMSLNCAIQLEIPDIIHSHGKAMTLSELVETLPVNNAKGPFIYRLMRILVHSGFFLKQNIPKNNLMEEDEEAYLLTPSSRLLLKDDPLSIRPLYVTMVDPIFIKPWHFVSEWFKKNDDETTTFETAHGKPFWDYASDSPYLNQLFNNGMACDGRLVASFLVKECKGVFAGISSLVDVGGGSGTLARAIAEVFPHLSCTVFDLPHVVADLEGTDNLSYVGGDMFEAIHPADAIILKWILHDWSDEECVTILQKCKSAIPSKEKGGKVIIIDMVVGNEKGDDCYKFVETKLFFDMMMMVYVTGKERTEKEWKQLFKRAGFNDYKITLFGLRSIIEVFP